MKKIAVRLLSVMVILMSHPAWAASKYFSYDAATNVWDTSSAFWGTSSGGPYNATWFSNDAAFFEGAPGTVVLSAAQTAQSVAFLSGGYTISNSILTLSSPAMVSNDVNAEISSVVAGSVGLAKGGAGMLALSGISTYTSNTTITAGTLMISGAGKLGNGTYAGAITNSATLVYASSAAQTLSGVISGAGVLVKDGSSTLALSNAGNSFTGGLIISNGTVTVTGSSTTSVGRGPVTINAGGTLSVISANGFGYSPTTATLLTLNGGVFAIGANAVTITPPIVANGGSFTGTSSIYVGSANGVTVNSNLVISCGVVLQGNMPVSVAGGVEASVSGVISAAFGISKNGSGTLTLGGANTYSGVTALNGGVLTLANINALQGSTLNSTNGGGTVSFGALTSAILGGLQGDKDLPLLNDGSAAVALTVGNNNGNTTYGGNLSGVGSSLSKVGSGLLVLTGVSTYTGDTTNKVGTLMIGGAGQLGSGNYAGAITNSGILVCGSTAEQTFSGIISGAGSLVKTGAGTLTVTGSNTLGGGTTVSNGLLRVNNAAGSGLGAGSVGVTSGGILGGTGVVNGAVTVNTGAKVAAGSGGIGILTVGSLILNAGSLVDVELDLSGGQTNDQIAVSGALTLNGGAFNLYQVGTTAPFTTPGTYNLIQYGGAIGGTGFHVLTVANPVAGLSYSFSVAGGWVAVTIGRQVSWNGGGGDDNWMTDANWSGGSHPLADDALIFGDSGASRVNNTNDLAAYTRIAGVTFSNGTYILNGAPIILVNNIVNTTNLSQTLNLDVVLNDASIFDAGSGSLILNGVISETNEPCGVTKTGTGTLILTNANTYSGGTTVNAGTLKVNNSSGSATGNGGVTVNGGATLVGDGMIVGAVAVSTGGVIAAGNGVGVLAVGSLTLAAGSTNIVEFDPSTSNDIVVVAGALTNNGCAVRFCTNGTTGAWAKTGTYTLFQIAGQLGGVGLPGFTVANPVPGLTYYFTTNGTALQVIIGGSPVWTGGGVDENWQTGGNWGGVAPAPGSTLIFNTSNRLVNSNDFAAGTPFAVTFTNTAGLFVLNGNAIALNGNVVNLSANAQTINNDLTLSGGGGTLSTSAGPITFNGSIGGSYAITKAGSGTVTLRGTNAYTGTMNINGGVLSVTGGDDRMPTNSAVILSSGTLDVAGVSQTLGDLDEANNTTGYVRGTGGILTLGAADFTVGGTAAGQPQTMDMRNLNAFVFNGSARTFSVGPQINVAGNERGYLYLAKTNTITAIKLDVGGFAQNIYSADSNNEDAQLYLGQVNVINADTINVGAEGGPRALVQFVGGLAANPTLAIRGTTGGSSRANVLIGRVGDVYTVPFTKMDLTTGVTGTSVLDAMAGTWEVASLVQNSCSAEFIMGGGALDATTLKVSHLLAGSAYGNNFTGRVRLNGGTIKAQTVQMSQDDGTGQSYGEFYLNSGTLVAGTVSPGNGSGKTFNWATGTISNYNGSTDLNINSGITITLSAGAHSFGISVGRTGIVSSALSGAGALSKDGDGVLNLMVANTYSGGTTVSGGKLRLAANGAVSQGTPVILNGGTLDVGGYTNSFSTLTVGLGASSLLIGAIPISFSNSSAVAWSGTLNLVGTLGAQSLRYGTSHDGLTPTQLQLMNFAGRRVSLDPNGYVVLATGTLIMIK